MKVLKGWIKRIRIGVGRLPKDILVILSVVFLVTVVLLFSSLDNSKSNIRYGKEYYNRELSMYIKLPYGWDYLENNNEEVSKQIKSVTNNMDFDLYVNKLEKEIVPVSFLEGASETKNGVVGEKFITFALRGIRSNEEKTDLGKELKDLLESKKSESIRVAKPKFIKSGNLNGFVTEGSAKTGGKRVYYYQYSEIVGLNVLTLTLGSIDRVNEKDYFNILLSSLMFNPETVDDRIEGLKNGDKKDELGDGVEEFDLFNKQENSEHSINDGHGHTEKELESSTSDSN